MTIRTTDINAAAVLKTTQNFPAGVPVFMVNLLRYKEYADYGNAAGSSPCSGKEIYFHRYVREFNRIAADEGVKVFFLGNVRAGLVAPEGEHWDDIAIVEYPDFACFRRITESDEYLTMALPHRQAALEDWRLIVTGRVIL